MKRILFAVVLDVVAILGLILFVVVPSVMPLESVPGMNKLYQDLLCEKQEIINVERFTTSRRPGETSYSAQFYCTYETRSRDVTAKAFLFGVLIFTIPLVISIFMYISGGISLTRQPHPDTSMPLSYKTSNAGLHISTSDTDERDSGQSASTTARLRTLKRAYDEGLISEMEYETKRQDILRDI